MSLYNELQPQGAQEEKTHDEVRPFHDAPVMEQLFAACSSATQSLLQGKKKGMCQFLGLKLLLSQFCSAKEIFSFSCSDLE